MYVLPIFQDRDSQSGGGEDLQGRDDPGQHEHTGERVGATPGRGILGGAREIHTRKVSLCIVQLSIISILTGSSVIWCYRKLNTT